MLLDSAIGIFSSIFVSWFFNFEISSSLVLVGIVFALLPDLDFLVEFIKHGSVGGKVIREHREIIHYPIIYVPVVILIYFLTGIFWATLFAMGIFSHFVHDSIGIGWGIKWFWPFSKKSYKLFSEKDGSFSSRLVVSWEPEELKEVVLKYGDPDWIKNIYLRLHPVSVIELMFFIFSLIILYFFLQ